jgi:hypothetical protein
MIGQEKMKCVLCGKEAQYVQSGMSLCEEHFKARQSGNREIDLLKIQIKTDKSHTRYTSSLSVIFACFSLIAVFIAFFFQGVTTSNLKLEIVGVIGMAMIYGLTIYFLDYAKKSYSERLKQVSKMIEAVEEGQQLPNLDKLDEWDGKRKTES